MGLILIADDVRTCRESIQKTLEREGHVVEGAADVDSAMMALAKRDSQTIGRGPTAQEAIPKAN